MVTHVSRCIWTGLLHDASGFYQFMEEVVTAKSFVPCGMNRGAPSDCSQILSSCDGE